MLLQPHVLRTSGHIPRDDKGKAGCTDKLPSHRIVIPETTRGTNRLSSGRGPPRKRQPTQEVTIPTDVGGLVHSNENRSSRHLSSTPESSVTYWR
ncbi:hypothetical protein BHE74_00016383 [Ensete ventricosum]|nr:hypothetical protein BHE74_00016383 [Ensete ventricosum]